MNDMPRWKPVTLGNPRLAVFAAAERPAFLKKTGACSAMYRTVDSPTAEEAGICSVDNCIDSLCGDVTLFHMEAIDDCLHFHGLILLSSYSMRLGSKGIRFDQLIDMNEYEINKKTDNVALHVY